MQQAPMYIPPFREAPGANTWSEELWDAALAAYQQKRYHDALRSFLIMLDPTNVPDGDLIGKRITLEHGSVRIHVDVSEEAFSVEVPFLRIPEGGRAIAMMRKVMNLTNELAMSRFLLRNNKELFIVHRDSISGTHPSKLSSAFSSAVTIADTYDDLFEDKFGAERVEAFEVETWDSEMLEKAHQAIATIIDDGLQFCKLFESKQHLQFAYNALQYTFERIIWTLWPQGILRSKIADTRRMLNDSSKGGSQRIELGKRAIREVGECSPEELGKSLYQAQFILPQQEDIDFERYQSALKGPRDLMVQMRKSRDYDYACFVGFHSIYEDLVDNQMPEEATSTYVDALNAVDGMSMSEASSALLVAIQKVAGLSIVGSEERQEDEVQTNIREMNRSQEARGQS